MPQRLTNNAHPCLVAYQVDMVRDKVYDMVFRIAEKMARCASVELLCLAEASRVARGAVADPILV